MLRFASALIASSLLVLTTDASAFCRTTTTEGFTPTNAQPCDETGPALFWASKCVGYSVARSASVQVNLATANQLVDAAFAEWSRHDCTASCGGAGKPSITARNLGPVDCRAVEHTQGGSNANVIIFRDDKWPYEAAALALTTVTYRKSDGEIYDVDMEVQSNPAEVKLAVADPVPPGEYDLRSILTHEAGHFLGLAHTQRSNNQATMFESYRPGETFMRDLSADDVCGICTAYPPSRSAACNDTPRGGLGNECGGEKNDVGCGCATPGAPATAPWAALVVIAALLYYRSRGARSVNQTPY